MTEKQPIGKSSLELDKATIVASNDTIAQPKLPPNGERAPSPAVEPAALKRLTPEEQMALYEKALKEDDWGHQPC